MYDISAFAIGCPPAEFRTIDTSLFHVLHKTTANEPLTTVKQVKGQKGFEARRAIVRRYDQRTTSDSAAFASLISNLSQETEPTT